MKLRTLKIFVLTLLTAFKCFGQSGTIDYDFINSALKQVNKYDGDYFQLESKGHICYLSNNKFELYKNELKDKIDTLTLKEIFFNSHLNTQLKFEFEAEYISTETGAHLISPTMIDSLQMIGYSSLPMNKRMFYICTMPVFNNKRTFAVIDFSGGTKRNAMQGQKYLFKRTTNGWKLIATFGEWTS